MTDDTLYLTVKNDKHLLLTGLSLTDDSGTVIYQDAASSMLGTLLDTEFNPIPGYINMPFVYVAGSQGNYTHAMDATFDIEYGMYFLEITGISSGKQINVKKKCAVVDRTN